MTGAAGARSELPWSSNVPGLGPFPSLLYFALFLADMVYGVATMVIQRTAESDVWTHLGAQPRQVLFVSSQGVGLTG